MVEKSAGGYISQLRMDDKDKNPQARKCYNCGSPDHYKKQCPQKKAAGGSRSGKKSGGKGGDKKKWVNENKDGKTKLKKDDTTYYWCKTCGYGKCCWVNLHKLEDCYRKRESGEKSGKDTEEVTEGNIALEIAECGFLAFL